MKTLNFILLCLTLIHIAFGAEAADMCASAFKAERAYKASQEVLDRFSYGFEVEFAPAQNPKILEYYKVTKFSDAEWSKITPEQRVSAFKEYVDHYPKAVRTMMASFGRMSLTRLKNAPETLPRDLSVEAHGTAEISGEVFKNESEMAVRIRLLSETLGKGYWQAHVVFPKSYSKDLTGFVVFSTDFAYIQSLSKSYEKYLSHPEAIPGSLLIHYALGPIHQKDFNKLIEKNDQAVNGGKIGKGGDSRLINGPALRDDTYPQGLAGMELRQFSTRQEDMIDEVSFTTKLVSENQMSKFNSFKEIQLLDHKIYEQLDPEPRARWQKFMRMADKATQKMSESVVVGGASYELRFLLPLRDWRNNPVVTESGLSAKDRALAQNKIARATLQYKADVEAMISNGLQGPEAVTALRVAISKWAHDSGLESLFVQYKGHFE